MKRTTPFEIETVLQTYLNYPNEIGNTQLKELFGVTSSSTIAKIKRKIREIMVADGTLVWNPQNVSTKSAFKYAGIDIENYKKIYQFNVTIDDLVNGDLRQ